MNDQWQQQQQCRSNLTRMSPRYISYIDCAKQKNNNNKRRDRNKWMKNNPDECDGIRRKATVAEIMLIKFSSNSSERESMNVKCTKYICIYKLICGTFDATPIENCQTDTQWQWQWCTVTAMFQIKDGHSMSAHNMLVPCHCLLTTYAHLTRCLCNYAASMAQNAFDSLPISSCHAKYNLLI